ncbi:MAG: beta-phosphoglucomutase [Saprospiraceae bacterium]
MRVHLFDIENQTDHILLEESQELIKTTQEYDISQIEPGYYHCIARKPEYHVEIKLNDEGLAIPKCHCAVFKKQKYCKHAIAALLLLRDFIQRGRKVKKRTNKDTLDEVLRKLSVTELKSFLSEYALSHSGLRAEILSNYLYRTKRPDYHSLFNDVAPLDKYGQIRLNRNNIKTVRAISSSLLRRTQELLKEKALPEAFLILEAVLVHLHRIWMKTTQFQDQLNTELKLTYRLFEALCLQPMAPRLQQRAINLAIEICSRDGYHIPTASKPLIQITEEFILEEKLKKEAFAIAEKKSLSDPVNRTRWTALVIHWKRLWSLKTNISKILKENEKMMPDVIRDLFHTGQYEDVLGAISSIDKQKFESGVLKNMLLSGLRAAKLTGAIDLVTSFAYELALHHLDQDSWEMLYEADKTKAKRVLDSVEDLYSAGTDEDADKLLLYSWRISGGYDQIISRLKAIGIIDHVMEFDHFLKDAFPNELASLYAVHIVNIREAYGGVMARQKLNNIFSHLNSIGMTDPVAAKLKKMESPAKGEVPTSNHVIKGFVFDLDGVIVDTAVHHFQSWKKILKELGADITEEDDHHTRGAGRMESLEYLLNQYSIQLTDEEKLQWAAKKNDVYVDAINSISPADLLPGALDFLEASRNAGLSLALGSASKNARAVLSKLNIADKFDAILDGNDAKASKPDPEIFLKACAALGLQPHEVVVFEDAPKGVQAALSAGCKAVGIGEDNNLSAAHIVIKGLHASDPAQIIGQLS